MHLQVASATLAALLLATARGTGFVMGPVLSEINKDAVQPYLNGQMSVS